MEFTDYIFYKNSYYGDTVPEESFNKWQMKSVDKIQYLCNNRINEDNLEDYPELKKATCAVMDILYKIDEAEKNATSAENGNIKSMSSGGQSVSFGNNDTVITNCIGNKKAQNKLIYETAEEYLLNTGLLYAGV